MNFQTCINPTWCPGCGNFGILGSLKAALTELNLKPHQVVLTYDVGCSSNMADFFQTYGFHSLHGRALPVGAGIKLANHTLPVINIIGDGGCYGEGVDHFIGLSKGNHDMVTLTHNNYLYSLTTGQKSPTTKKGIKTPSTPNGSIDQELNPLALALINQATFVARGFAGDIPHLTKLLIQAIKHQGFALLDVLQPCITYNKKYTYQWYRDQLDYLGDLHDPSNFDQALKKALVTDRLPIGLFYQADKKPFHQHYHLLSNKPLVDYSFDNIDISTLLNSFS
jgi:2-oxoglutarate/2-oxoacid ferredoxin oxidoreductase subunit beta